MDDDSACPRCGSTRFHYQDGILFCENGDQQQGGPVVAEDDQDYSQRGRIIRVIEKREKTKVSRILRGNKAYQLYLQAWQHILWKQSYTLIHSQKLPPELWMIVRDLWTLRLTKLADKLEERNEGVAEADTKVSAEDSAEQTATNDTEDEDDANRLKKEKMESRNPNLIDTIALNYIGILLLRQPLPLSFIYRWAQDETIPFVRAVRHVPSEMLERLPGEYERLLDTITILEPDDLQLAVLRNASMLRSSFGMEIPSLNFRPLLLSYIETLALPIQIYPLAKHLNEITKFEFNYPHSTGSRRSAVAFPESQLMALVVIATKLLFPFDSATIKRYPESLKDPGALMMSWTDWLVSKRQFEQQTSADHIIKPGTEMSLKDLDILQMSKDQLDHYMDWFQRTWIQQQNKRTGIDREIIDMFPLKQLPDPSPLTQNHQDQHSKEQELRTGRLKQTLASMKSRRPISEADAVTLSEKGYPPVLRPGMMYQRFHSVTQLSENEIAKVFHEEAAQVACLGLETLLRAVNSTEQMIVMWKRAKRRAEAFGEEMDLDAELGVPRTFDGSVDTAAHAEASAGGTGIGSTGVDVGLEKGMEELDL